MRYDLPRPAQVGLKLESWRLVVARAVPDQLSGYEKLTTDDEQLQFCLRLFGPTGVVWTEPYRAAIRAEAMKSLGQNAAVSNRDFLERMGKHWNDLNGIHFGTKAEYQKDVMAVWLLMEVPIPIGMEKVQAAAVMALEKKQQLRRGQERRAKEADPIGALNGIAVNRPGKDGEPLDQFKESGLQEQAGEAQLHQAAVWLSSSETILLGTVWPTAASEVFISLDSTMKAIVDEDGDATTLDKWQSWGARERTEEVAHLGRLLAAAGETVLTEDDLQVDNVVSPNMIHRYFPDVSEAKMDAGGRARLSRATAVADAAYWILFLTSDPLPSTKANNGQ